MAGAEDVSLQTAAKASMVTARVSKLNVLELKRALKSQHLSTEGKKGELAERLFLAMVEESTVVVDGSIMEGSPLVGALRENPGKAGEDDASGRQETGNASLPVAVS